MLNVVSDGPMSRSTPGPDGRHLGTVETGHRTTVG
jgi:hypothetical protein